MSNKGMTYQDAGVDVAAGQALVDKIKPIAKQTHGPEVLSGLGGFAGLFELPLNRYQQPVLVSGTDGVGTKLKLAIELDQHDGIGIDLVAMCVNDLLVCGAEPLFFLDYFATGKLDPEQAAKVIASIGQGCQQAGAALLGGETAEMPGVYHGDDYDLAGFCVGVVEKEKMIDGSRVNAGDALIALGSSGPHSNGYSLIRKIITDKQIDLQQTLEDKTLAQHLLAPTRIYVKSLLALLKQQTIHAMAHITGGGFYENIPRVLPDNLKAVIDQQSWQLPAIFTWLREQGNIDNTEMLRTFNCGVGMIICVPAGEVSDCLAALQQAGETAWQIGVIETKQANDNTVDVIA